MAVGDVTKGSPRGPSLPRRRLRGWELGCVHLLQSWGGLWELFGTVVFLVWGSLALLARTGNYVTSQ